MQIKITTKTRRSILKMAWGMVKTRNGGLSLADAMRKAWAAVKTKLALETTDERGQWIRFIKADGSERWALATRTIRYIPIEKRPTGLKPEDNPLIVKFYDLMASDWRSFRGDRLIIS